MVAFEAEIIATYGRHVRVRDEHGVVHEARPFGRRLELACGDRVKCEHDTRHDTVSVTDHLPRTTALYRSNLRGDAEIVVANLTHLLVTIAPLPEPDYFVVDRYLAAAASAGIASIVVVNKVDLGKDASMDAELRAYEALGAATLSCSAQAGDGLDALREALAKATAALVGQSGVGKSSLVNALAPSAQLSTGELVRQTEEGRHTTTAATMHALPGGGRLIDSPGVRDFSPAIDHLEPTSMGFADVAWLAPGCRFLDCQHLREPGCAVSAAAGTEKLSARRYESYRRMRRLHEKLVQARPAHARGRRG